MREALLRDFPHARLQLNAQDEASSTADFAIFAIVIVCRCVLPCAHRHARSTRISSACLPRATRGSSTRTRERHALRSRSARWPRLEHVSSDHANRTRKTSRSPISARCLRMWNRDRW